MQTVLKVLLGSTLLLAVAGVGAAVTTITQTTPSPILTPSPALSPSPTMKPKPTMTPSPTPSQPGGRMSPPGSMMAAKTVNFKCAQGKAFKASFGKEQAEVTLLDTRQALLMRQVPSGAGIQYVNAGYHLFSKGKTARLEVKGKPVYQQCVTP